MRNILRLVRPTALYISLIFVAWQGTGVSGATRSGWYLTPSGYRVPVMGKTVVRDRSGNITGFECVRLETAQIERLRIGRTVSRSMRDLSPQVTVQAESGMTFRISYTDPAGKGFNDSRDGAARKRAIEAVFAAWSGVLQGTVRVQVEAAMEDQAPDSHLLASAGPTDLFENNDVLFPSALAKQLSGRNLNNDATDIQVNVNPAQPWDYNVLGTAPAGKASFVYTLIHEIGHGLGFIDSFDPDTGEIGNDYPFPYDIFINRGKSKLDQILFHDVFKVWDDLESDDLFFNGEFANAAVKRSIRPGPMIKLYAPLTYEQGSSISHVDQDTYADFKTGLMTPRDFGSGTNKIDILTLGIMQDMGYKVMWTAQTARFGGKP
jgi:hypothetical protein